MASKKKEVPKVPTVIVESLKGNAAPVPVEPTGDFRRMAREAGPHTARTLSIAMDMLVFDAAAYAALNGILSHHGTNMEPKLAAGYALQYAKELVEQRRAFKKA
jgi:hypothetical protein